MHICARMHANEIGYNVDNRDGFQIKACNTYKRNDRDIEGEKKGLTMELCSYSM